MNKTTQNPLIAGFDSLLAIRDFAHRNPKDLNALFVSFCRAHSDLSFSQLFQDLFVVYILKGKRNGFFVEFGATDGHLLSNTAVLERDFDWRGLLAEPAKYWHTALKNNRSAAVDHRCVWSKTGEMLSFKETVMPELSTLVTLVESDFNNDGRVDGKTYSVETVSLNDLLEFHKCPRQIDYISIDTEGSELEILSTFKFEDFDISVITVEHNYREPNRKLIFDLLTSKGYIRLFEAFSKYDDWYVKQSNVGFTISPN